MATSIVALDLTQYVRVNVGYTSMILQAHRDEVRIVISEAKPAKANEAFMSLGGDDAPLHLDIVDTNVWVLSVSDRSSLIVTESDTSFATEESLSQLVMAITNAIDETDYDLNASAFSETTSITNDYELDSVEFNFTTSESKTITITTVDGTLILNETTTDVSFAWQPSSELGFNGGDNLTVEVTQFSSVGTMDCVLKIKSGTNTLLGDPHVGFIDVNGTKHGYQLAGSGRPRISVVDYGHEIAAGNLPGHIPLIGFGEREDLATPTGNIGIDVWGGPTDVIPHPLVTGEQMSIVSTSVEDGPGGTGILTARLEYIDGNGNAQGTNVIMDGTTPVNLNPSDVAFINHAFGTSRGANGVAVGNITIYKTASPNTVYNIILAGGNKDLTIAVRIPDNVTYFLNEWHGSVAGNKPTAIRLRSTDWNGILYNGDDSVFIFKDTAFMAEGNFDRNFDPPLKIPGGSTIKTSAWAQQAGAFITSSFNGFYE